MKEQRSLWKVEECTGGSKSNATESTRRYKAVCR